MPPVLKVSPTSASKRWPLSHDGGTRASSVLRDERTGNLHDGDDIEDPPRGRGRVLLSGSGVAPAGHGPVDSQDDEGAKNGQQPGPEVEEFGEASAEDQ